MRLDEPLKNRRLKILCLHGTGTNSEVFEAQTAALRYQLGETFEYDFVDGEYHCSAARGISEIFGDDQIYYSYFDGSADSAMKATRDLLAYTDENGPFDAVMGFSLGAALAVMLLLHVNQLQAAGEQIPVRLPFKCAILLCGVLPYSLTELQRGQKKLLHPEETGAIIRIPTVHAWSPNDVDYPGHSRLLMQMCDPAKRVDIAHCVGHGVPSRGEELIKLAQAICSAVGGISELDM
ncbi:serine hydrolase FSH [Aspergillus pseudotamarii]|uniref:Serine hydrolase FSH n=1 Tax=Aspergillus pseudotamarii TaxID=132259 RepID=A0A5N6TC40_ASPPS|nr:serine hydrolase FSH [Aspergillus pseudotamarii]KAE8143893.1 serine hydrolase FSH [Aspergillus pseudotamarii]